MWQQLAKTTNAVKAQAIVAVNALLALLATFHVVLTQKQIGAIDLALNALFGLYVAVTYTQSRKRIDPPVPPKVAP